MLSDPEYKEPPVKVESEESGEAVGGRQHRQQRAKPAQLRCISCQLDFANREEVRLHKEICPAVPRYAVFPIPYRYL